MFYALAMVLCLTVFFLAAAGASLACGLCFRMGKRFFHHLAPRSLANVLFVLRALPWFLAALVTLGFALPAFWRFEPRSSHEELGIRLLILGSLGAWLIAVVLFRCLRLLWDTRRTEKQWLQGSRRLYIQGVNIPIYCASGAAPLVVVTGFFRPKIFVAQTVAERLSCEELFAAIAHELAHVTAGDNLKQLFLKTTNRLAWLKLFAGCDVMWTNASEMAADEGALAGGASALDLSAALVKVAGVSGQVLASDRLAASHLLPSTAQSCMAMRVNHLRQLLEAEEPTLQKRPKRGYWSAYSFLALVLGYTICVNATLPWIHEMLEMLVK
jgi:Zn-dependent protease with chaperone function